MGISLAATVLTAWISSYFLPAVLLSVIAGVAAGAVDVREDRAQLFRGLGGGRPVPNDLQARARVRLDGGQRLLDLVHDGGRHLANEGEARLAAAEEVHGMVTGLLGC